MENIAPRHDRRRTHRYLERMITRSLQFNLQKIHSWFEYELGLCEVDNSNFSEEDFFDKMKTRFPKETIEIFKKEYDKAMEEANPEL